MNNIKTVEDIYPAIEELIKEMRMCENIKLADILYHRMHKVAWTTRSELFEELKRTITTALQSKEYMFPENIKNQLQKIVKMISIK